MEEDLKTLIQSLFKQFGSNIVDENNFSYKIIFTIAILFIGFWTFRGFKKLISKNIKNVKTQNIIYKTIKNLYVLIILILLLVTWVNAQNSILFIIIIFGAISIFSIKNLSTNFVAWFMLLRKNYFKLYDRIVIEDMEGDVIKITPFYFKLMERGEGLSSSSATGRTINVPNHILLSSPIYNYNNFIQINWKEVEYHITIDSDWKSTLTIVEEQINSYINNFYNSYNKKSLDKLERKLDTFDGNLNLKSYVLLEEDYIKVVGQFPVNYKNRTATVSSLNKSILTQLQNFHGIELTGEKVHVKLD